MQHAEGDAVPGTERRMSCGECSEKWCVEKSASGRVPRLFGQASASQRGFLDALVKSLYVLINAIRQTERVSSSPRKLAVQAHPKPYVHTDPLCNAFIYKPTLPPTVSYSNAMQCALAARET